MALESTPKPKMNLPSDRGSIHYNTLHVDLQNSPSMEAPGTDTCGEQHVQLGTSTCFFLQFDINAGSVDTFTFTIIARSLKAMADFANLPVVRAGFPVYNVIYM